MPPDSSGLWEKASSVLFSGAAIDDGPLLGGPHRSNIPDYLRTMRRLRDIPARIVHGGYNGSFGQDRLRALAES